MKVRCWLFAASVAVPVRAAPCNLPDLLESLPADGSSGVPTNAQPAALYAVSADYLDEPVIVREENGPELPVDVTFDRAEGLLRVRPLEPLRAQTAHVVVWPELRGIGTASKGRAATVRFVTGSGPDLVLPEFGGVTDSDWRFEREVDDCTDRVEARFVFDVDLAPAADDGPHSGLLLRVFQTAGPRIDPAAPEPVLVRRWPASGRVEVVRTENTGLGRICFSALVSDLVGQTSGGGERQSCVTTVEPPFFEGCGVVRSRGRGWSGVLLGLGLGLLVQRRLRRR